MGKNYNRYEIRRQIVEVYGENTISHPIITKWCQMFKNGRTNVSDELHLGRPSTVNTTDNAQRVKEMILTNYYIKIREIASELNISYMVVCLQLFTIRLLTVRCLTAGCHVC